MVLFMYTPVECLLHNVFSAVLVIYFASYFGCSKAAAVVIFHSFSCLAYLFPIFGAVVADGHWGRYSYVIIVNSTVVSLAILKIKT